MGITLGSNFDVQTGLPLDSRTVVADLTARDAINALQRYEGLEVYVESEEKKFFLKGGITNSDWVESGTGGGGVSPDGIVEVDANYSATADDQCLFFRNTVSATTIILPDTTTLELGHTILVKRLDASDSYDYDVAVYDTMSELIDDATTSVKFYNQGQAMRFILIDTGTWGVF